MYGRALLVAGITSLSFAAHAQTVDSPVATMAPDPFRCIPHGELFDRMAAEGFVRKMTEPNADGRLLEVYFNAGTQLWRITIVSRPTGRVTRSSCTIFFAEGDPGVLIPPDPASPEP